MSLIQSVILGIIQGITEFLPVSSSAHLVIIPELFDWTEQSLLFDIIVHCGTLVAILTYYRTRIFTILKGIFGKQKHARNEQLTLVKYLIITTIPTVIAFLFAKDYLDNKLQSINVIIFSLIFWGTLLIITEIFSKKNNSSKTINPISAGLIGIGQGMSLIRGVSRSGAMLTMGLFSGVERKQLVEYVFLAGIPVILAGLFFEVLDYSNTNSGQDVLPILTGFLASAMSGLVAIHIINRFIDRRILLFSGIYRILLALVLIIVL